jgi:hypothetical protein
LPAIAARRRVVGGTVVGMGGARRVFAVILALVLATAAPLHAQQGGAPVPDAPPPPPSPSPSPDTDTPDVVAAYDAGIEAFLEGDYDEAARLFDDVAARSVEPERRGAARELGKLSRRMKAAQGAGAVDDQGNPQLVVKDGSGRASFVTATTVASFYASFVLLDTFDVDDYRPSVAIVTLTTAAGFLGSFYGTRRLRVSEGMAEAYSTGIWVGLANGLLLGPKLGFDIDPDEGSGDGEIAQSWLTFGLVTMALGGAGGAWLGHQYDVTPGQARIAGTLGFNGAATVGLGLAIFQPEFDDEDTYAVIIAGGLDLGLAAGIVAAPKIDWSKSRVTYVTLAEFLGALGGFATSALLIGSDPSEQEGKITATAVLGGMWGGFALGAYLTRDMEPDPQFGNKKKKAGAGGVSWQLAPVRLGRGGSATGIGVFGTF